MIIAIPHETYPGERRVALVPKDLKALSALGAQIEVESGAGLPAGYPDEAYQTGGATIEADRGKLLDKGELILQVRGYGSNLDVGKADLSHFGPDKTLIGMHDPLSEPEAAQELAKTGATMLSLELMPRISRAQNMDVLSSMATIAGYKAVLTAADHLAKMFPMLMTAAGTITPARVFIIGVGVAGLQAIATARRLGAQVRAYDIRPAVKEQVESLGAKFVELELESTGAEAEGGYAKEMDEAFYRRQRELMTKVVGESDVVITTAAVPGKKAPILVTGEMVEGMKPGAVVVDIAAERGGNCELTSPGETIQHGDVTILGPLNLASEIPNHASQMYSRNLLNLLSLLIKDGAIQLNSEDEIVRETLVAQGGQVVQARVRELLHGSEKVPGEEGEA